MIDENILIPTPDETAKDSPVPLIDLSPLVSSTAPHWPGDHGFTTGTRWSHDAGDSVTVATITTTGHIGAHVDSPSHVLPGGATSEATPIDACIGPCVVVDVSDAIDSTRSPHGFAPLDAVRARLRRLSGEVRQPEPPIERLLLRHRAAGAPGWDTDSPGIDPELVRWFGDQGGRLIGLDLDSFDPLQSTQLPAHRAAISAGIVIVEGLDLSEAPETSGDERPELFALPIRWAGVDAVPVRAVLRT